MRFASLCRVLAVATLFHFAMPATAAPIVYTLSGVGSGHIGNDAFTDASFVFTGTADTDALVPIGGGVSVVPLLSLQVSVAGHGAGAAVDAFDFFVNNALAGAGFIDELSGDVLDVLAPLLAGFDGISALGPLSVDLDYLAPFITTAGEFQLDGARALSFSAQTDTLSVPLPATSWLVLLALAAAAGASPGVARRRVQPR